MSVAYFEAYFETIGKEIFRRKKKGKVFFALIVINISLDFTGKTEYRLFVQTILKFKKFIHF